MKKKSKAMQEQGEIVINYNEREKRHVEIMRKLYEAYPMVGGSNEDSLWRSLSTNMDRDLNLLTQRRMQDIAFYLYDSNPMAKRIIEIITDFCVGDGFNYMVSDPEVREVIDEFWNDPDNNMDEEIAIYITEMHVFGELCLPVWVNSANGAVKLLYIDPKTILKIKKNPNNTKINKTLIWRKPTGSVERELNIINTDKNTRSKTYGRLIGDCFYFTINKVSSATRGRSTLLCLSDWLDGYDQFLFARLERAFLLNNFIWDVECQGMNRKELEEFVKTLGIPRPGSIRAHNEKVIWKSETPKLESADASEEARLFKNQILGGAGFPEHWFAEGSRTTRATALEMGLPTLKKLKSHQRQIKFMLQRIFNFVIDQAIIKERLDEDIDRSFKIIPSPIVSRDNKGIAESMNGLVQGLQVAKQNKWIDDKKAKTVINAVITQLGVDMENDDEEENEDNNENISSASSESSSSSNSSSNGSSSSINGTEVA
jgi:hypothetical protein